MSGNFSSGGGGGGFSQNLEYELLRFHILINYFSHSFIQTLRHFCERLLNEKKRNIKENLDKQSLKFRKVFHESVFQSVTGNWFNLLSYSSSNSLSSQKSSLNRRCTGGSHRSNFRNIFHIKKFSMKNFRIAYNIMCFFNLENTIVYLFLILVVI